MTEKTILQERLRSKMEQDGISGREIARQSTLRDAPLNLGAVNDILKGTVKNPRIDTLEKIANILVTTVAWLTGKTDDDKPLGRADIIVRGVVEAGTWRETMEWTADETFLITVPPDDRWPYAQRFGLLVRGVSMNAIYPDGTILICARLEDIRRDPRHGERVIVQRLNRDGLCESTCKEFRVDDSGASWLWPRSDHPDFQSPILWRRSELSDTAKHASYIAPTGTSDRSETAITALVIALIIKEPAKE